MNNEAFMATTSMFLQKLIDSGIIEHHLRTSAAEKSWDNYTWKNVETGKLVIRRNGPPMGKWVRANRN